MTKDNDVHEAITTSLNGPRQELNIKLRSPHGESIAGVVVDHAGRPIVGADLVNPGRSSGIYREARTGKDGRFRIDNLYESIIGHELIVSAKGFAPKQLKVKPRPAAISAEFTITLEPGHRIKGRVVDDKERPMEGVDIYFGGANHGYEGGGKTTTDAQGRFEFDSLPANTTFAFYKHGYSRIENRQLPLDGNAVVTVEMVPAGVIVGKALDAATGQPIPAFNVQVTFSTRRLPGEPSVVLRADLNEPGQVFQSNEGRFQIGDLVVGMPLQVTVSAQGYERRVMERVVVARADRAPVEEFRLDPLDPKNLRTYRGRLVDAAGKPVVGAQLRLFAARNRDPEQRTEFPFNWTMIHTGQMAHQPNVVRFLESSTDARGLYEFTGIPGGTEVELAWWGKGIANGRADHLERRDERKAGWFETTLPAPARVVGRFDRKNYPAAAQVQISSSGGLLDDSDLELNPDQADFEFGDLAPGEYTVQLSTAFERIPDKPGAVWNKVLATAQVAVVPGQTARVEFKP